MQPPCKATTTAGQPCRKKAMVGSELCAFHLSLGGRPTELTTEIAEALVNAILAGNYLAVALRAAGIANRSYSRWMSRGRAGEQPYADFRQRVERARAQAEARHVAVVTRAAIDGNWQASAWMLEREWPDRWGRVSVRMREDVAPQPEAPEDDQDDPGREVDELAARRARGQ